MKKYLYWLLLYKLEDLHSLGKPNHRKKKHHK